ncbi:MAG: peptidyl-prolyl cis-trans isomerase [Thermodesulfobacteriota bacterium]|jgi:peptidyl-prolyl cis-trans isomerase C|nr:peptidyl-prolyl cis-trans isomerase [Thermodesulfobacteriota bacterium]
MDKVVFHRKSRIFSSLLVLSALAVLIVASGLAGCRNQPDSSSPVLLRIDDRVMRLDEFNRRFAATLPLDHTLAQNEKDELRRSFLRQVIDQELALAEARRRGIHVDEAEVEAALAEMRRDYPDGNFDRMLSRRNLSLERIREDLTERLMIDKVLEQEVHRKIKVGAEEIADYYATHRDEFVRPLRVRARQILVDNEEQGEEIVARLRNGASFVEMAQRFSLSPDGDQGGDLGFFPRGEMPSRFDEVVFDLAPGELSPLVSSEYGYHIFRVEEVRPAQNLSLEQAEEEIRARLRRQKEAAARRAWLLDLGARSELEVNWPLL